MVLRPAGGIAFALALGSGEDIEEEDGKAILNSTLPIVLIIVLGVGGFTVHALEFYKIQMGRSETFRRTSKIQKYQVLEEEGRGGKMRWEGGVYRLVCAAPPRLARSRLLSGNIFFPSSQETLARTAGVTDTEWSCQITKHR